MEEWACVFSFVTVVSSSAPPPFLKANDFGIDLFFLIDNEFKVLEEYAEVDWEQAEKSRSSIVSCLYGK